MAKLSDAEFERVFKITLVRHLPEEKRKMNEINQLFDEMQERHKLTSFQIFQKFGVLDERGAFLEDVRTCPEKILEYCRTQLAPKADAA